ncbi:MAG: lectin like domain-containing protein [Propionibacteriaceae bacterium]|jgi:C1A family cysteine protease|nr:lectin like domain-containing protein [Propionibacteriaceae bacterium]
MLSQGWKQRFGVAGAALALLLVSLPAVSAPADEANEINGSFIALVSPDRKTRLAVLEAAEGEAGGLRGPAAATLPAQYDLRTAKPQLVDAVRDQGNYGTCWGFGATAVASASLVHNSLASSVVPLSPKHLAYAVSGAFGLHSTVSDLYTNSSEAPMMLGGYFELTMSAWSNWMGPRTEASFPYPTSGPPDPSPITTKAQIYSADYHLDEAYTLPGPYAAGSNKLNSDFVEANVTAVKEHIYNVGPLAMDIKSKGTVVNWYTGSKTDADHMVTVVGWDDTFSQDNFSTKPAGNGAWIAQNSYGATSGSGGYIYVSYYDKSVNFFDYYSLTSAADYGVNQSWALNSDITWDNEDTNNQRRRDIYAANVYTASANQSVKAVLVSNTTIGNSYTVDIYRNVSTTPSTGVRIPEAQATRSNAKYGVETVELATPVVVAAGEKYAVVVHYTNTKSEFSGPMLEAEVVYASSTSNVKTMEVPADAKIVAGQSYIGYDGSTWKDLATEGRFNESQIGNLMLPALGDYTSAPPQPLPTPTETATASPSPTPSISTTVPSSTETVGAPAPTQTTAKVDAIRGPQSKVYLKQKTTYQLYAAAYLGATKTSQKVTWKSSNTKIATVSSTGKVKTKAVKSTKKVVISASSNGITKKITVYVVPKAKKLGTVVLSYAAKLSVGYSSFVTVNAGKATNPKLTFKTSNSHLVVNKYGQTTAKSKGSAKLYVYVGSHRITKTITIR